MPTFWTCRVAVLSFQPLKIQAQTLKNTGKTNIYVFGIEDDLPVAANGLIPFSSAIVSPGLVVDLTTHPYINGNVSDPDRDVTLHSDGEICVEITSSDSCDRWKNENHPWNGFPLPNGQYTNKYAKYGHTPTGNLGYAIPSGGIGGGTVAGIPGSIPLPTPVPQFTTTSRDPIGFLPISISIDNGPKCTCPSHTLFSQGCICGHLKRKNWGL